MPSRAQTIIAITLRAMLVLALIGAGWSIYRHLPKDGLATFKGARPASETMLHIRMRPLSNDSAQASEITLYSIDVVAAQHEFSAEHHPGLRFEDFLARRMGGRTPITTHLDKDGQASIFVPPGRWWIHATQTAAHELTWRLPVIVSGREQTVELTPENAYMRTQSF